MMRCPRVDDLSEKECEKKCEKIYEEYVPKLEHRYQGENKEKIDEVVTGAPSFTSTPRKDRQGLLYRIFHW